MGRRTSTTFKFQDRSKELLNQELSGNGFIDVQLGFKESRIKRK